LVIEDADPNDVVGNLRCRCADANDSRRRQTHNKGDIKPHRPPLLAADPIGSQQ
jgi:hypothetical protein